MGFPSTGNEGMYRNHAEHVTDFLAAKHGEKVKVYNLCSERDYPVSLFDGRVAKYPFDDHNPPPMQMFLPFCRDVKQWLDSDPENVVAIHCKAGKGRTGVMICAYLLYIGEWEDADECMAFYGTARTHNGKGVTIPSQKRFIRYFAELCRGKGVEIKSSVGTPTQYPDEVLKLAEKARRDKLAGVERESGSSDDESERETAAPPPSSLSLVALPDGGGGGVVLGAEREEGGGEAGEAAAHRPVVLTPGGAAFTDYSETGSNLADNLERARAAAHPKKRPTYAQASFWMSSHQETVHQIFLDSGVPGGLLGGDQAGPEEVLALEDGGAGQRQRGEVLPPVVLAVVQLRLSAVPLLGPLRGASSFQPIFSLKGAGYCIWSTDFLPQTTYRGKGAITFAIPGNNRGIYLCLVNLFAALTLICIVCCLMCYNLNSAGINVVDEVLFTIYNKTSFGKDKIASFWLHTAFIKHNCVTLTKPEIDKINKDKRHKKFPSDFTVQVMFDEVLFEVDQFDGNAVQEQAL
jgi:protein-tyrosine phosphatase